MVVSVETVVLIVAGLVVGVVVLAVLMVARFLAGLTRYGLYLALRLAVFSALAHLVR